MYETLNRFLKKNFQTIRDAGLYKEERIITSPQGAVIRLSDGKESLNFCATIIRTIISPKSY
jgi:glycine C-acetyltransferase